ncbi:septum formation protein Maf [Bordetella sp. J329]|jgi:septum formation protein|nr:Maf family nucleotide pyrophosphatase [Kerstersia gyiorum]AZV94659.1 septum formation protein Maf [Bordetella sp. J329]MCH4271685.1 Maf family nucleotide pyrophosphatase [Kerstersia gyiorum]MCI1228720.1 Maf family nucleotide pyrophosphatase [Kerstersia gyiorum]MCP1632493.1 septum formation protein [Kerstersia gyiorum]MCP1635002.1 septum formation protein [Kerstersia gyiorum]
MPSSLPASSPHPQLILASSSRYRRGMLERLALPFESISPDVDETPQPGEMPAALALRLSIAKAQAVARQRPGSIVIGSDQVATLGNDPIGKPGSFDRALEQLRRLSGQIVTFHSALAVTDGHTVLHDDIITECHFRQLDDAEITAYLLADQPFDTAGSAKAESLGITLMERMRSDDPTAIIGLPLIALSRMLRHFGLSATQGAAA